MSIFKQRLSRATKRNIIIVAAIAVILVALVIADLIFHGPLTSLLTNKDETVAFVRSLGPFGWIAYLLLSIIQIVIAPIPGQVVGLIGGYLFGWWGVPLTILATAIGAYIILRISRRFGRPLVEKMIKKESLDKFDYLTKEKGSLVFFVIFLIPWLPDDVVCYIAGLTDIPIRRLIILLLLGRLPAIVMTNFLGAGIGEDNLRPVIIATIISVVVLAIVLSQKDRIMALINSHKGK